MNVVCGRGRPRRRQKCCASTSLLENDPDKNWEDYLSEEFLSIAQVDKVSNTGEWMYYGAMEKKHGKDELDDMIKKGKLETTTDQWNDTMYRRKRIITTSEQIKEHKAVIGNKSNINAGEHDKMSGAINALCQGAWHVGTPGLEGFV